MYDIQIEQSYVYHIVGNFRGMKLSRNCVKFDFRIFFKIHDSLENRFGKVIAMCINTSRLYFHEAVKSKVAAKKWLQQC